MSLPTSTLAYSQCYDVLDKALEDPLGVRMKMPSLTVALHFRMRCHQARKLDREKNADIYPDADNPLHGRSAYDVLIIRDPRMATDGTVYLVIERSDIAIDDAIVEPLSEAEPVEFKPIERISSEPQMLIEGPKQAVRRR